MRTNCLDCLNRTNMAQTVLGLQSASAQLKALCSACDLPGAMAVTAGLETTLHAVLRKLWSDTGDVISLQYTGTSNLSKGFSITGDASKKSFFDRASGLVEKGVKTVNRFVHEQFLEDTRQAAIDSLLGAGKGARERRESSVASDLDYRPLMLFVGTWNVNGKVCSIAELLAWFRAPWQQLGSAAPSEPPSACIIGFQEFVDLNAQNLLIDTAGRRKECRERVQAALHDMYGEKCAA